jgi:hypothetical protein
VNNLLIIDLINFLIRLTKRAHFPKIQTGREVNEKMFRNLVWNMYKKKNYEQEIKHQEDVKNLPQNRNRLLLSRVNNALNHPSQNQEMRLNKSRKSLTNNAINDIINVNRLNINSFGEMKSY